jgi:hypothetical protein
MDLILRVNYSDESIALIQQIYEEQGKLAPTYRTIYVIYINTGWAADHWHRRVEQGEALARSYQFTPVQLTAKATFPDLVQERQNFPSRKFQWCAGFLKGLPFLEWLDEHDPSAQFCIALPKRAALYRQPLPEYIEECPYHGDRKIWHPLVNISDEQRDQLVQRAGFVASPGRSLECDPCVNSTPSEQQKLSENDRTKLADLEQQVGKVMFTQRLSQSNEKARMQSFSMGCGDPFGCGL